MNCNNAYLAKKQKLWKSFFKHFYDLHFLYISIRLLYKKERKKERKKETKKDKQKEIKNNTAQG
jgi:hypothetical protein